MGVEEQQARGGYGEEIEPTAEEQRAIRTLERLAKRWPESLYIYSAAGSLCVMRKEADGSHGELSGGGIDQRLLLATIDIENTGGDW